MAASIVFQLLRIGEHPRTMVSTAYLDSSLGSYVGFLTCPVVCVSTMQVLWTAKYLGN